MLVLWHSLEGNIIFNNEDCNPEDVFEINVL